MTRRFHIRKAVSALIAAALLATSCAAQPSVNVSPESAIQLEQLRPVADNRIDLTLVRSDEPCNKLGIPALDDTSVTTAHYVVNGKLGQRCYGPPDETLVETWELLVQITAPEHLRSISVFAGFKYWDNTGWRAVSMAHLYDASGSQFSVDLDHAARPKSDIVRTLAITQGQVMSVAPLEFLWLSEDEPCPTVQIYDFCYRESSLLYQWTEEFWDDQLRSQYRTDTSISRAQAHPICLANPGFWDTHSAISPGHDFAAAYASFVLDIEALTPEQQEKIDWFAERPVMYAARERARAWGHAPHVRNLPRCV